MRSLVVLPTYNEAGNIARILDAVRRACPEAGVLVVDDSSPDGTAEVVKRVAEEATGIELLVRPGKGGLGTAYKTGFAWGIERGYEAFVEMDSDFSHDPGDLPRILAPLATGAAEVVIGSRYVPGGAIPNWSASRRLLSRLGNLYAKHALGLGVEDSTAGYRAYARSVLERLELESVRADSYGFQIEMTYLSICAGAKVVEVPIRFVDRVEGDSKMSSHTVTEALVIVTQLGLRRLAGGRPEARELARVASPLAQR